MMPRSARVRPRHRPLIASVPATVDPPRLVHSQPVRCHFPIHRYLASPRHPEPVNLLATITSAAQTRRPSKPGPIGSWEELALRQLRILRMVELLAKGYSYRGIAREMG